MDEVIYLTDESDEELPFQIISEIELNGSCYVILASLDEEDDDAVVIFQVTDDEYIPVEDNALIQRVFDVFRSSDEDYEFCDAE